MMERKFELATTRDINGLTLNCYRENGQDDLSGEFWMTREQIGRLLEYSKPVIAIGKIHQRNKERLDRFSRVHQIDLPSGGIQSVTIYNFKGLLEICRYSTQPNAHKVIDVLWDIADEIRRTGMYITTQALRRLEERVAVLENEIASSYPVRLLGEIVLARPESITVQSAAQFLSQHGVKTGQNRLYEYCRKNKLLCSRRGTQYNKPTQRSIERGLFNLEIQNGFSAMTMVTPKGLQHLAEELTSEQYPLLQAIEAGE